MIATAVAAGISNPRLVLAKTFVPKPTSLLIKSIPIPSPLSMKPRWIRSTPNASPSPFATVSRRHKTLKSRLVAGETLYGLFLLSASPTLAEIAGLAGYDYVVVDMEHGPGGISSALPCLQALAATRTPAVLRLPEPSPTWAKKALDLGPQGVMFPMIETPHAAELAVASCRFPPRGIRGSAHTVVRASSYGINDKYLHQCEDNEFLVICQVETVSGVDNIGGIIGVEGVDVVQMGPMDLSASMGYLHDSGNPKVQSVLRDAERKVLATSKDASEAHRGLWLGGFAMPPHDPPEALGMRGYQMVAGAVDIGMFRKAAMEDVARFRNALGEEGEEEDDWSE